MCSYISVSQSRLERAFTATFGLSNQFVSDICYLAPGVPTEGKAITREARQGLGITVLKVVCITVGRQAERRPESIQE